MRKAICFSILVVSFFSLIAGNYVNHFLAIDAVKQSEQVELLERTSASTAETNGLGQVGTQEMIDEIKRQLQPLFEGKSEIAFDSFLNALQVQLDIFAFWDILLNTVSQEGTSGPVAQAFKVLTFDRLSSSPEQANQTVKDLAEKIQINSESPDFDKLALLEISKAATAKIDSSNSTNDNVALIASIIATDDDDNDTKHNLLQVLYQLGLNVHNRGGNVSKVFSSLHNDVTSEMVQAVPFEMLSLTQSLLHLAELKSSGDISDILALNSILDAIASQSIGSEELIGSKIVEFRNTSTTISLDTILNYVQTGKLHLNKSIDALPVHDYDLRVILTGRVNGDVEISSALLYGLRNPFLLAIFPPRVLDIQNFSLDSNGTGIKYVASHNSTASDGLNITISGESQFSTDIRDLFRNNTGAFMAPLVSVNDSFNMSLTYTNGSKMTAQSDDFKSFVERSPFL
jgi:hypothetical protein